MSFTVKDLADKLQARIEGDDSRSLDDVSALASAQGRHLSFVDSRKQLEALRTTQAGAVLVTPALAAEAASCPATRLLVAQPQTAFIAAMLLFRPPAERPSLRRSPQATVDPTASWGADCNIHPFAVIGANVTIGVRCDIGPGVVIGDGCVIGDDCVLHAHSVLYPRVTVGNRVLIHAQAVIGADGFGYRFVSGAFQKIPHTGTVLLEDDVEIGACTTVDRAMIEATIIGRGTKLDNQVMIAHNCRVGKHNVFASHVGLAGSVTTGDYVQMGGQVGVADHLHIGSGVKLGGKAGVMDNLLEAGVYHGIPALPEKDAIKNVLAIRRIPELRDQIKQLSAQLAALNVQLAAMTGQSAPAAPDTRAAA